MSSRRPTLPKIARARMEAGAAFIYHVSEGTDPALVAEYDKLHDEDCLKPTFCGIHWEERLGRLKPGLHGDVLVTTDRGGDPYLNLITSIERDVLFVAINGYPFYGTYNLMRAARAEHTEPISVGRLRRRIVMIYPGIKDADMGWAAVLEDIAEATRDPVARYLEIERLQKVGEPPPWLRTDKPWDDPEVTDQPVPVTVRIPPLDPLAHSATYFNAIERSPLHGQLLSGLRD